MSTMTIDEYNAVVQDSVLDISSVMNASIMRDATAIADPQLTPEAKFEQVKNALYSSLDEASAYARTRAGDTAIATGSKISESYWKTVADSFDKWKLKASSATSLDNIVDAYAKGAVQTFQGVSKNAPSVVGLAVALTQAVNTIRNSNDMSAISDSLGLMSMTVTSIAISEVLMAGVSLVPGLL